MITGLLYVIVYYIFLMLFYENILVLFQTCQLALPFNVKNIDRNQIGDIFVYAFGEYYLQVVRRGL